MNLIIFASIIAVSYAAQLPTRNYLPSSSQGQSQSQGSFQQSSFQSLSSSSSGSGDTGNRRPQQEAEKNAAIVKQDQEITENGFHYSYETSNGIKSEEAGNAAQTQGGFSYKGDDGNTYSVTFTAGEGGFQAQGAHLPVPPPTPVEILLALEQNAKDEAAGIFDDGKYRPDAQSGSHAAGQGSSSFSSSSSSVLSSFGSANHQSSFSPSTGYKY